MEFEENESEWFQMYPVQVNSEQGNFWNKETKSQNISLNTTLSTDIYV